MSPLLCVHNRLCIEQVVDVIYKQLCSVYEDTIAVVVFVCTTSAVQASLQQLLHAAPETGMSQSSVFCCCEVIRETSTSNITSLQTFLAAD